MTTHARVLGMAQDAGVPHLGCACAPCQRFRDAPLLPSALGLVGINRYLIDATPAITAQIHALGAMPAAIFLTHQHMGHITGLLHLGEEAAAVRELPVYAGPELGAFLSKHEPWRRLVVQKRIDLRVMTPGDTVTLEPDLACESFAVSHRGVETVGYFVRGPQRTLLYLPDIDRWDGELNHWLARCDVALLDGTFFTHAELGRQADVPHPPIETTWALLTPTQRAQVKFLHLNHTNRLLDPTRPDVPVAAREIPLAQQGERIEL